MFGNRPTRAKPDVRPTAGIEFGWKVHAALQDWTRTADQKASIMLAFAVALATVAGREVLDADGHLHAAQGAHLWVLRAMGAAFALAALAALSVVFPRLRHRAARREASDGLIYFGHIRRRSISDIERALKRLDEDDEMRLLAQQLRATSDIAWRKHARLQLAMVALVAGAGLFAFELLAQ